MITLPLGRCPNVNSPFLCLWSLAYLFLAPISRACPSPQRELADRFGMIDPDEKHIRKGIPATARAVFVVGYVLWPHWRKCLICGPDNNARKLSVAVRTEATPPPTPFPLPFGQVRAKEIAGAWMAERTLVTFAVALPDASFPLCGSAASPCVGTTYFLEKHSFSPHFMLESCWERHSESSLWPSLAYRCCILSPICILESAELISTPIEDQHVSPIPLIAQPGQQAQALHPVPRDHREEL